MHSANDEDYAPPRIDVDEVRITLLSVITDWRWGPWFLSSSNPARDLGPHWQLRIYTNYSSAEALSRIFTGRVRYYIRQALNAPEGYDCVETRHGSALYRIGKIPNAAKREFDAYIAEHTNGVE
jgi:hypothetical protein